MHSDLTILDGWSGSRLRIMTSLKCEYCAEDVRWLIVRYESPDTGGIFNGYRHFCDYCANVKLTKYPWYSIVGKVG